jgi:uncharacterized membrane protein
MKNFLFFQKNSSPSDHAAIVLWLLLRQLGVKVTRTSVNKVKHQKDYPSIASLVTALQEWNIDCMPVHISTEQLAEIPYPAIAHLTKNGGHFVILLGVNDSLITYHDPDSGHVTMPLTQFCMEWKGVVLLVEKGQHAGEDDYVIKRRIEYIQQISPIIAGGFALLVAIALLWLLPTFFYPILFLKLFGILISILLLQEQFGEGSTTSANLCGLHPKINCRAVLNSQPAKLFGVISISEIVCIYFIAGLLTLTFWSVAASNRLPAGLALMALTATPVTLLSIWYQGAILKTWCSLCIITTFVIWLELTFLLSTWKLDYTPISWLTWFMAGALTLIAWLSTRKKLIFFPTGAKIEHIMNQFIYSERIFKALLRNQAKADTTPFVNEVQTGPTAAKMQIVFVSNLLCGPCSQAHNIVMSIKRLFPEDINIIYRFAQLKNQQNSLYDNILALIAARSPLTMQVINDWYSKRETTNWAVQRLSNSETNHALATQIAEEHWNWCRKVNITATPTILINGKKIPEEFPLTTLKFHLRKMISDG